MRRMIFAGILVLLVAEGEMAVTRARLNAGYFSQPGSSATLLELLAVLAAYLMLAIWLDSKPESRLLPDEQTALMAGAAAGLLETGGVVFENFAPGLKLLPIAIEFSIFLSWATVAAVSARRRQSITAGIRTAVAAAALCMVIGVCAGELVEFFIRPAPASEVATWAEFQRSHWSDAGAFQVANTIDSATTHLTMAPLIAFLLGSAGAALGRAGRPSRGAHTG